MKQKEKSSLPGLQKAPVAEQGRTPLILLVVPQHPEHRALFEELKKGISVLPCDTVFLDSTASDHTEEYLKEADMAVVFPEHMALLPRLFTHGTVPIAHVDFPLVENYHPNEETGNAFTYAQYNAWDIFRALVRAHETYRFPYDWNHIVRNLTPGNL